MDNNGRVIEGLDKDPSFLKTFAAITAAAVTVTASAGMLIDHFVDAKKNQQETSSIIEQYYFANRETGAPKIVDLKIGPGAYYDSEYLLAMAPSRQSGCTDVQAHSVSNDMFSGITRVDPKLAVPVSTFCR